MKAFNKLSNDLKSMDYCNKTIKCKLRDSPAISHNIKNIWERPAETGHRARAVPFSRKRRSV